MPNATPPAAIKSQQAVQQSARLPASLQKALADPFAFGNHPDVAWRLPEELPPLTDLQAGVRLLEAKTARVTKTHAAFCLSKLVTGFNTGWSDEQTMEQLSIWLEANGDLPNDLWSSATLNLLQSHKFGMPKPPHLRDAVEVEFRKRTTELRRAREMLDVVDEQRKPRAFEKDPPDARLRTLRDGLLKIGKRFRAAGYERDLAALEKREPDDWARNPPTEQQVADKADDVKLPPPSPEAQARLNLALAKSWRARGIDARAESLERQARELAPQIFEPAPEYRDVPVQA